MASIGRLLKRSRYNGDVSVVYKTTTVSEKHQRKRVRCDRSATRKRYTDMSLECMKACGCHSNRHCHTRAEGVIGTTQGDKVGRCGCFWVCKFPCSNLIPYLHFWVRLTAQSEFKFSFGLRPAMTSAMNRRRRWQKREVTHERVQGLDSGSK